MYCQCCRRCLLPMLAADAAAETHHAPPLPPCLPLPSPLLPFPVLSSPLLSTSLLSSPLTHAPLVQPPTSQGSWRAGLATSGMLEAGRIPLHYFERAEPPPPIKDTRENMYLGRDDALPTPPQKKTNKA